MNPIRRLVPNRWARLLLAGALLTVAAVVLGRQAWAYSEFRAAQREAARYKLDAAQAHLTECLKIWGARSSVWALAGQVARRREAYDEAERYLVRMIPDETRGYTYDPRHVLDPATSAVEGVIPHLRDLEALLGIAGADLDLDLGDSHGVIDMQTDE